MRTAILVDGGFFIKRYRSIYGINAAQEMAANLYTICLSHIKDKKNSEVSILYRIFFYDCKPFEKKIHHPITKKCIDFSKTEEAMFRNALHLELVKLRKVALRLGRIAELGDWQIHEGVLKEILKGKKEIKDLKDKDLFFGMKQKGVDMKIGLDIASLCFKKQVDQIVLIAGDSDFVPAAKLARREGIDFILDPMWNNIANDLHEHIDGLRSTCRKPITKKCDSTLILK